jgi:hypothetical protein
MSPLSIILPCFAMVAITAAVWLRLYVVRIGEMRARHIRPQDISTSRQAAEKLLNVNAADNFRNLFEVPVLFYVLCILALAAQAVNPTLVGGAWAFVALRALHSFIHCTYNRVMHRFAVYMLSTLILFGLWGVFGVNLWQSQV